MAFSAAGLRQLRDTVQVLPLWRLPPGLTLEVQGAPVPAADGHWLRVDLELSKDGAVLTRRDKLSAPGFVQEGAAGAVQPLGVGKRLRLEPGVLYLSHNARGQQSMAVHEEQREFGQRPTPSRRFSRALVVFLSLLVAAFHILLVVYLYREYLSN